MNGDFILDILRGEISKGLKKFRDGVIKRSLMGEDVNNDITLLNEIDKTRYAHYDIIENKIYRMINIMKTEKTKHRIEGMLYSLIVFYDLNTVCLNGLFALTFNDKEMVRKEVSIIMGKLREKM